MKIFTILTVLLIPFMAHGAVQQWVDEDGIRHFGDKSPPQVVKPQSKNTDDRRAVKNKSAINTNTNVAEKTAEKSLTITAPKIQYPPLAVTDNAKPATSVSTDNGRNSGRSDNNNAPLKIKMGRKSHKSTVAKPSNTRKVSVKKPAVRTSIKNKKKFQAVAVKTIKITRKLKPKQRQAMKKRAVDDGKEQKAELCGVYTLYVNDYRKKLKRCSGGVCKVYQSSLSRYQTKQRKYCP